MSRRRIPVAALVAWLPVACLLGLTLLASPGSSQTRVAGSLDFSPRHFYGGQALTFTGSLGHSGKQKIWLELNENRSGDDWVKIDGSNQTTDSSGHFKFQFPARGMNNILVRVASARSVTPSVLFQARDQAVSLAVRPSDGSLYDGGPCGAGFNEFISYDAVASEPFTIDVDSTPDPRDPEPVLKGRKVTLQKRGAANTWTRVGDSKQLDQDGEATFDVTLGSTNSVAYRVVLGDVSSGINQIGWFPSFPTYVDPLHRPDPAAAPAVTDPDAGLPNPTELLAGWTLPADPDVEKVVVAWRQGLPPATLDDADDSVIVGPGDVAHAKDLVPDRDYGFSVFTRSADGICAPAVSATGHTEPTPPATGVVAIPSWDHVDLSWTLPPVAVDDIKVRRADGDTPPTSPAGGVQFPVDGDATSFTDWTVAESSTYSYSVFTRINGVWSVAASTSVPVTTGAQP